MNANSSNWNNMYANSSDWGALQNYFNGESSNNNQEWFIYENKLFETYLAQLDLNSPNLYENMRVVMPWKTLEQIKIRFENLITDVAMIEMGEIAPPNYDNNNNNDGGVRVDDNKVDKRKGVPWTDEEHRRFLIGLAKLGKGEWKNIAKYFVPTKTAAQVASHAQKYFRRANKCTTPLDKRRYSIHDIRLLNSDIVETSARNPARHSLITRVPALHFNFHCANNVNININTTTTNNNNNIDTTTNKAPQQQQMYPEANDINTATFNNNNFGTTTTTDVMTTGSDFNYMGGLDGYNYMGSFDQLTNNNYDKVPNYGELPNNTDQYPTNNYGELPNYDQFPTNYELPNYDQLPTNYDQIPTNYGDELPNYDQNTTNYAEVPNYGELFTSPYWVPQSSDHELAPLPN